MKKFKIKTFISFFLVSICAAQLYSQKKPELCLEEIMQGYDWVGSLPSQFRWSEDSETIYFMWNPEDYPSDSLYSYNLKSNEIEKVDSEKRKQIPPRQRVYNRDRTMMVYTRDGDLFLKDLENSEKMQLTNTLESISSPSFTKEGKKITYVLENNLFLKDIETGKVKQLTDFRQESPPSEKDPSEQEQWLKDQQMELFDYLRERKEMRELREKQQEQTRPERPETIYLGNQRVANIQLCPQKRFVTYNIYKQPSDVKSTVIPNFITESGYTEDFNARPKVGSPQTVVGMGIYDLENKDSYRIETSEIPGIRDVPEYKYEYGFEGDEYEKDRDVNITALFWSDNGEHAVVNISSHDNKDRWIMQVDPETGELSPLDRQRDEAWIAGPGIYARHGSGMGWMPDNRRIWFHSEESGYSHLYTVDVVTGEKKALTSGEFEIYGPFISRDENWWYFSSNEVHPGIRHFYRMPIEGGERIKITEMKGRNDVTLSPDEEKLAIRYSYSNKPWELYIMDNKPGADAKRLTRSLSEDFKNYEWRVPEVITFTAEDGEDVWARLYRPDEDVKNDAAVIFVHGAGYLQNVHKWWSSYFREYMFHNLLVDMGYTVLDIDFRASAGYGRDWRTGIYRHMGGKDLSDNADGARFLVEEHGIDPDKIGIYGGSYGGFITLMAMFNNPDVFSAGAALRSVTDWAHYNHGYTSNILNTPTADPIAYERSSPINFAEGLEGSLLMCHGMVDGNVQFQDIVRLSQRLIELGKEDWELAVYPVEGHSFTEPSSWLDEYRRILNLFEDNLR